MAQKIAENIHPQQGIAKVRIMHV